MRVAVVGAGIVGASAAYELLDRGAQVDCFEEEEPFSGRSSGDTRIFRLAHADRKLVTLALDAHERWQAWSRLAGTELVGDEGLIITGPSARRYAEGMRLAGLPADITAETPDGWRLPVGEAAGPVLLDEKAGVIDGLATSKFLLAAIGRRMIRETVERLEFAGEGISVITSAATRSYDAVIVAAGAGTSALASTVGVEMPSDRKRHTRFTFLMKPPLESVACWIDSSEDWRTGFTSYSHTASPGHWAIGASLAEEDTAWELGEKEVERRSREVVSAYVAERMPLIEPTPVAALSCDLPVPDEDGFGTHRLERITFVWGHNLYKFAPLLGASLADAAEGKEALSSAL